MAHVLYQFNAINKDWLIFCEQHVQKYKNVIEFQSVD